MAVINIHERALPATTDHISTLVAGLAGADDRLWPKDTWPAMQFDRPLGTGAIGGHGPIRYTVTHYVPDQWIRCQFTGPRGVDGFHEFTWHTNENGQAVLRHTLAIHTTGQMRLRWPIIIRPLHDALLEDLLDRAEQATTGHVTRPARWSPYVRLLRAMSKLRLSRRPRSSPRSVSSDAR